MCATSGEILPDNKNLLKLLYENAEDKIKLTITNHKLSNFKNIKMISLLACVVASSSSILVYLLNKKKKLQINSTNNANSNKTAIIEQPKQEIKSNQTQIVANKVQTQPIINKANQNTPNVFNKIASV